jgi:GT2 family glycosyltransferase
MNRASGEMQVAALQRLIASMRERLDFVEASRFWKLRALWFSLKARVGFRHDPAPPPIPPREYVEAMAASDPYTAWLLEHEPRPADLLRLEEIAKLLPSRPTIAIVVDDAAGDAAEAVRSVQGQVYPWVRLVKTAGAGPYDDAAARLNAALSACSEELIAFCGPWQRLAPDAAFEVALALNEVPDADLVYGDRDILDERGRRSSRSSLPEWSPETFLSQMYTGSLLFYRREAVAAAGGFRAGFGEGLHYDLALRVTERANAIVHRPRVLHYDLALSAFRANFSAVDGRALAVASALERRGEPGRVEAFPGVDLVYVVRYELRRPGLVDILIPTRDLADHLERCLSSVFTRSSYRDIRVTVIDNGSVQPTTARLLEAWKQRETSRFSVLRIEEPFNFSRLVNAAVRATGGPYLLLLNNDTEVLSVDWIEAMLEQAQRPSIGAVGARLFYGDGTLQHAGVVIPPNGLPYHVHRGANAQDSGPDNAVFSIRNYSALTAACLMVRREIYEQVGGFDEDFALEYNDVDFCLRVGAAGYRNVYLPHVTLTHYESLSRGTADTPAKRRRSFQERKLFRVRWSEYRDANFNPNADSSSRSAG